MRRALLLLALAAGNAAAGVYEHVDKASGMTIMNNLPPAAGAAPVAAVRQVGPAAPASAQTFPRVSSAQQNQRDGARRDILASELQTEEEALAAAAAKRAASDVLARHAANVAALKRELAGVR